jgi:signal transduction histidine kinase
MSDESPTGETAPSAPRKGIRASVQAALMAALIPLVCGVLVVGVTGARLAETDRRLDTGLARVASAWLADRLALAGEGSRAQLLASAGAKLGGLVGLFDTDGLPIDETPLAELPESDIRRALAGALDETVIDGQQYGIASTALRPPLGRLNVVVAIPDRASEGTLLPALARLALIALALVVAAVIFGAGFGSDFGAAVDRLRLWTRAVAGDPLGAPSAAGPPAADGIGEPARAVERLRARLGGESSAYQDARAEVEAIDGERTDLLTSVSGELHTPLQRVVEIAGRLLDGADGELKKSQQEDVRIIRNAGQRLLKMVEEVVDLSDLVATETKLDAELVDLAAVAREVVETARGQVGKKQLTVTLEQEDPEDSILVRGNRQRLWQVVTNLVSNGIKFTERGGVTVRVGREEDGSARLEIEDSGVGISPMDKRAIFDTFRQLGGRGGRKRGTGLGLAISKRLIEMHGGKVRVSSLLNQGTKFTVILPEAE